MLKKSLIIIATIILAIAAKAEDLDFFELKGAVKTCSINDGTGKTNVYTFSEDGWWLTQNGENVDKLVTRDEYGHIISQTDTDNAIVMKFEYDSHLRPYKTTVEIPQGNMTTLSKYGVNGDIVSSEISVMGQTITTIYNITKRDDHGNWTERECSVLGQKMIQTRVIEYYE